MERGPVTGTSTLTPVIERRRRVAKPLIVDVAVGLGVALVSLGIACLYLQLWHADLRVPFAYSGDGMGTALHAKNLMGGLDFYSSPRLGWPDGQDLIDIPLGSDDGHLFAIWALGAVAGSFGEAMNLYFLLTFALIAGAAFAGLRLLGISRVAASALSIVYAFLPYHFARGESHLFLSGYFLVPLAVVVLLWQLNPQTALVAPRSRPERFGWRGGLTIAVCLGLGFTGAYYAGFFALLLLPCAAIVALVYRSWSVILSALTCAGITAMSVLVNVAPTLLHWRANGPNAALTRAVGENEVYGLKIAQLFLPIPDHRIDLFARLSAYTRNVPLGSESGQQLGILGSLGVAALLMAAAWKIASGRDERPIPQLVSSLSLMTIVAMLLAAMGGLSTFVVLASVDAIRVYSRISVVLGFLGLVVVGLGFDHLRRGWLAKPIVAIGAAVALVAVGVLDQTPAFRSNYRESSAAFHSDAAFTAAVESRLPAKAPIFQLPIVPFPESPPLGRMQDYDHLRGFLHSRSLRFSYGTVKGRDDWQLRLSGLPTRPLVRAVRALGFRAIWVDRFGYGDGGARLETELRDIVGSPLLVSPDGRLALFDLGLPPAPGDALPVAFARAPFILATQQFQPVHPGADEPVYEGAGRDATLVVVNPTKRSRAAEAEFGLTLPPLPGALVRLRFGARTLVVRGESRAHRCRIRFTAPPGESRISFGYEGPNPEGVPVPGLPLAAPAYFQVVGFAAYDREVRPATGNFSCD